MLLAKLRQFVSWRVVTLVMCGLLSLGFVRYGFFNFEEAHERGLSYNLFTGELTMQDRPGWHTHAPWTLVTSVDLRPQRVCITSSAKAAINCKLVQFKPTEYTSFLKTEGFSYYWWSNRISFNLGHERTYRGFVDIMRGYAFSIEQYPFIEEVQ